MPELDHPPSFQHYPRDYFADENVQALEQLPDPDRHIAVAGYMRLRYRAWLQPRPGYLPGSDAELARLSGLCERWPEYREIISRCFKIEGEFWVQKRLVRERAAQLERRARHQQAGKQGGLKSRRSKNKVSPAVANESKPKRGQPPAVASAVEEESKSKPSRASITEVGAEQRDRRPAHPGTAGSQDHDSWHGEPPRGMTSVASLLPAVLPGALTRDQVAAEIARAHPASRAPDARDQLEAAERAGLIHRDVLGEWVDGPKP